MRIILLIAAMLLGTSTAHTAEKMTCTNITTFKRLAEHYNLKPKSPDDVKMLYQENETFMYALLHTPDGRYVHVLHAKFKSCVSDTNIKDYPLQAVLLDSTARTQEN